MTNKYLTKVALFGFSKKKNEPINEQTNEEFNLASKRIGKFLEDSHRLYGKHFNKHIGGINESLFDKGKAVTNVEYKKAIIDKVHSPELKAEHKALHDEYKADMLKLKSPVMDHEYAYKDFLDRQSKYF